MSAQTDSTFGEGEAGYIQVGLRFLAPRGKTRTGRSRPFI